jgi:hypothetical protein
VRKPHRLHPQILIDLAVRLPAYSGVVAARSRAEAEDGPTAVVGAGDLREVEASQAALLVDPILGAEFEFG